MTNKEDVRMRRLIKPLVGLVALGATLVPGPASAAGQPLAMPDSDMHFQTTTVGSIPPGPPQSTVAHWFGQTTDPVNGVTYGYNIVGSDPAANTTTTVTVDIVPLNVIVEGVAFNGSDRTAAVLSSPIFGDGDYTSTSTVTDTNFNSSPGGPLSSGNTDVQLQDAIMRSQFNRVGTGYHLVLAPVVHDAVAITVPAEQGILFQGSRGIVFPMVSFSWWSTRLQNLTGSVPYADPTHLLLFLTHDVLLYTGRDPLTGCCFLGFHGVANATHAYGPLNGRGDQPIQTFAWTSWLSPGLSPFWSIQDVLVLTHEIAEWADDPFATNFVQPYPVFPPEPSLGCTSILEVGDLVGGIAFDEGTNTIDQGPNPNGVTYSDGSFHLEDAAFLPWFLRIAPNTLTQATQVASPNVGRYTFMGTLNPFYSSFQAPASGC
jgi:hypothetical protein